MAVEEESRAAGRKPNGSAAAASCRGCGCVDRDDKRAEEVPEWLERLDRDLASHVDVHPLLAAGEAPLAAIMQAADGVAPGAGLIIEAPFDPRPLRRVLAGKGFATYAERLKPGHWRVWCRLDEQANNAPAPAAPQPSAGRVWRTGKIVHIDVRGLEAPRPLVAILALIDGGEHHGHIVVHHNRDPLYLYPELDDRGWQYTRLPSPEDEVRLELRGPR